MLLATFLLATGVATSADFVNPAVITPDDYPQQSIRRNEEGAMQTLVVVDPQGKIDRCDIIVSSTHRLLDEAACRAIRKARAKPARDRSDQSVYGVFKRWHRFFMPAPGTYGQGRMPQSVDTEIHVNRLPASLSSYYPVTVLNVVVDEQGGMESCDVAQGSGSSSLDAIACDTGAGLLHIAPVLTQAGTAVRSVQQFRIGFAVKTAATQDSPKNDQPLTPPEPPASPPSP